MTSKILGSAAATSTLIASSCHENVCASASLNMINESTRLLSGQSTAYSAAYTSIDPQPTSQPGRKPGISVRQTLKTTSHFLFWIQAALVVLIATFAWEKFIENDEFLNVFQLFTGVEIMVLVGFGYLHSFMKRYGTSALGFTLFVTAIGLQWGILTEVSLLA